MLRIWLLALVLGACDHEGPNQIDGRWDGPPRDARPGDGAVTADGTPDAGAPDAPPPDAATDGP